MLNTCNVDEYFQNTPADLSLNRPRGAINENLALGANIKFQFQSTTYMYNNQ